MKLEVELLQYPTEENNHEAVCRAVAESKNGELFADIGDANPSNTASMIAKHIIRMASTRAKARALREMCSIGMPLFTRNVADEYFSVLWDCQVPQPP
jgi:hypothetical protein